MNGDPTDAEYLLARVAVMKDHSKSKQAEGMLRIYENLCASNRAAERGLFCDIIDFIEKP